MKKNNKIFNIVIAGTGGQGLITLTQIIAEAALLEGFDLKTSELHGLSQRGGSVQTHIRFGKTVYSPLILFGQADLIIGLEILEGLRAFSYANSQTVFLVNKHSVSFPGCPAEEEVVKNIKKLVKGPKYIIPASEICKMDLGKEVLSGVYLLALAVVKNLIPLKSSSVLKAISKIVPERYLELNKKTFELARQQRSPSS